MIPTPSPSDLTPSPTHRNLRIYAFDPSVSATIDTVGIGEITIPVIWEDNLQTGPVGEYIEVIDIDPASGAFYKPVNLNDPRILAQNGLAPSESNPQFHQQMVYAVAMSTIRHFEQALGRVALWSSARPSSFDTEDEKFVRRLRIYPHALRDRNAFYSPAKKALLFGYFPVDVKDAENTPGTMVYTCISHDIIAHETTHALLDGVHPRFNEPMNPDVLAFHEAFADIVALFQHFSYPGVLRDQISRTRGNLANENLLAKLAQQFGKASGRGNALRDALGHSDQQSGKWIPRQPNVHALDNLRRPHDRGAILVAAVFGAFLRVYQSRSADLFRIATNGTGVLQEGAIHPDLANRLASEAARCAQQVLQMCIRAIDYCPPVGITFGDYLRAIVTADYDINREDPDNYRLAFVECFRAWGISPRNMLSMSVDGLLWPSGQEVMDDFNVHIDNDAIPSLFAEEREMADDAETPRRRSTPQSGKIRLSWDLDSDRYKTWEAADKQARSLWSWLVKGKGRSLLPAIGLSAEEIPGKRTIFNSASRPDELAISVQSVRSALRRSPKGGSTTDLVVEITQRRRGYFDPEAQRLQDARPDRIPREEKGDFLYRAGCTLLLDAKTMEFRRVIRTPATVDNNEELNRMRSYLTNTLERSNAFQSVHQILDSNEPFALLHK